MLPHNLDVYSNNGKTQNIEHTGGMSNANEDDISKSNVLKTNINVESLNIANIKKETYYKMKFIMNSLEKNWAIKKKENSFLFKKFRQFYN